MVPPMSVIRLPILSAFIFLLCGPVAAATGELPQLGADLRETSVSGLSSGGYMAGQFHVAHSKSVRGAAIVAAGPYACANSGVAQSTSMFAVGIAANMTQAQTGCMKTSLSKIADVLDGKRLAGFAAELASQGKIDPLEGLSGGKVYLYSGKDDNKVAPPVVAAARDFYQAAGVPAQNLDFISGKDGGHAFLSDKAGNDCSSSETPYVDNCHYDQAGAILNFIYGNLSPKGKAVEGNFITFDQDRYGSEDANLASEGVAYVPTACRSRGACKVHVVFHGCNQSRKDVGDALTHGTDYADWAETNNIIVLFPQAAPSTLNPLTCWDWWGYTGLNFYTRDAPQIKAVNAMIEAVAARTQ